MPIPFSSELGRRSPRIYDDIQPGKRREGLCVEIKVVGTRGLDVVGDRRCASSGCFGVLTEDGV